MNSKIVLFGDGCTGKTTMYQKICNYSNNEYTFDKKYKATDDYTFKRMQLNTSFGHIGIDLWDTAGQENHGGKMRDAYLKGADGVLLFYDVSEKKSVANIPEWLAQIKRVEPFIPVVVIGNKSDKISDLTQYDTVKLRECNLQRDIGHSSIKNFLVSIKNDTYVNSKSSFWSTVTTHENSKGCLVGLEYLLTKLHNKNITISHDDNLPKL